MSLFLRVISSFFYDLMVLLALSVVLSAFFTGIFGTEFHNDHVSLLIFQFFWFLMCCAYFAFSWRYGGQTIGMKAWKIRVTNDYGTPLSWKEVGGRLVGSFLSLLLLNLGWLGYLMSIKMSFTDWFSSTFIDFIDS